MPITNQVSTAGAVSAERTASASSAKLGGHHVDNDKAGPPRFVKGLLGIGAAIKKSFSDLKLSVDNALARRADAKVRKAQERMDREVTKLLKTLAKQSPVSVTTDRANANEILLNLKKVAEPLTSQGRSYEDEFKRSLGVSIRKLDRAELMGLEHNMGRNERLSESSPHRGAILTAVRNATVETMAAQKTNADKIMVALNSPLMREELREYCAGEFSGENLQFLEALEKLSNMTDLAKAKDFAKQIIQQRVAPGSEHQVNISSSQSASVINTDIDGLTSVAAIHASFSTASGEVTSVLASDTGERFLRKLGVS